MIPMREEDLITMLEEDTENGMAMIIDLYGDAVKTICYSILNGFPREDIQETISDDIDGIEKPLDFNLEAEVLRKSDYEVVNTLIQELNSPDKEIFLYRYYKQYSIKEIADLLKLSAKIVENKLTRGRKKLKKQLLQCGITM